MKLAPFVFAGLGAVLIGLYAKSVGQGPGSAVLLIVGVCLVAWGYQEND